MLWDTIVDSFSRDPRDVKTIPTRGNGRWFYVSSKDGNIYISTALNHAPSSQLQKTRLLEKGKCDAMFAIYQRRKVGEPVSQEATDITRNQVYWYGIFRELGF